MADLGGARGAVAPPHLVSQDIQRDGCVVIKTHKNTLILANNILQCIAIYTFQRVAPTTPPGTILVSSFSQNFIRFDLNTLNLALDGISVLHKRGRRDPQL